MIRFQTQRPALRKPRRMRGVSVHCWACLIGLAAAVIIAFSTANEATAQEAAVATAESAKAPAAKPLFNGKNLDGWIQRGGKATYEIEGDAIVGTSVAKTPNSFLCTDRDYGDFILEVDFKVDEGLNSGIQIRSQSFDKKKQIEVTNAEGKQDKLTIPANRVHGYQVEIDTSPRAWSAGIYDEGRRGWLNNLEGPKNKPAREAFKNGQWNHYRIECRGDSIKTWINGVPAADLKDDLTAKGFIALQVHGVSDDMVGKQVRWKNIMLTDLSEK